MNKHIKLATSLTSLIVLGFAVASDAHAGSKQLRHTTDKQIQTCVAEIGRHADYDDASRVVHWVVSLQQKNLVELTIKIETAVYGQAGEEIARGYTASCVTGTMGDLVKFRFNEGDITRMTASHRMAANYG